MNSPLVSVIMGIYNTKNKEYLKKSLDSILNQTFKDFELIICDDGSTNDCLKWAKEICGNDKRVIYISNEVNSGLAITLNHCLKFARGKYIARMDDDDCSEINRFEKQVKYLEKHNDVDLVSCNINIFDENGIYSEKKYPIHINKKDFLFNSPIVHPAIMATRKSFDLVNGYCEAKKAIRVEDYDLFMRMYSLGIKMDVIQEKLFNYRDDINTQIRRKKFKYRINEFIIRVENFYRLKLYPIGLLYIFKPIVISIIPIRILKLIKKVGE